MAKNSLLEKELQYAHLNLDLEQVKWDKLRIILDNYRSIEQANEIIQIIRDPKNFYFTLRYIFNIKPTVFQLVLLQELWNRPYPLLIASRGASKSWLLALYAILRALITQGAKIVIVSASFRQSKNVFDYAENIFNSSPILKDLCMGAYHITHGQDVHDFRIGDSTIKAIPLGTSGEKIRGLRATHLVVDEKQSIPEEIYEVVIGGFGAVTMSPSENVEKFAKVNLLKEKGLWTPAHEKKLAISDRPNQTIITGTGDWGFKDFAKMWKRWKLIVNSGGDKEKITQALGVEPGPSFDYRDFSVIRLPYELIPEGFMDIKHIEKQKLTVHIARFQAEYNSIFPDDSDGFFKRTLIESCSTKNEIELPSGPVKFRATLAGDPYKKYVFGIDPASESANFAIVILELNPDHRRVVYCWTTMRKKNIARAKTEGDMDFYQFIAKKIRHLMSLFPCQYIALDSQGGGYSVMEALHNLKALEEGELPLWPILEDDPLFYPGSKNYGYDDEAGLHIIEMVSFSRVEYMVESNHGLKSDMESKVLLFPYASPLEATFAEYEDKTSGKLIDNMSDCVFEIEELKDELSTIHHSTTLTGKDKWDTPETTLENNKKGRLRKDRYSALLMANMAARRLNRPTTIDHQKTPPGGIAYNIAMNPIPTKEKKFYTGPEWANTPDCNPELWGMGIHAIGGGRGNFGYNPDHNRRSVL